MRSTVLVTSLQLCFESCPRSYTGPLIVLMLSMLFMISEKWWSLARSYKFCANKLTGVPFLTLSVIEQKRSIKAAANEVPGRFKGICKIKWPHQFFPALNLWVHPGTKDCFCKLGHLEFKVRLNDTVQADHKFQRDSSDYLLMSNTGVWRVSSFSTFLRTRQISLWSSDKNLSSYFRMFW